MPETNQSDVNLDQYQSHLAPDLEINSLLDQRMKDWAENEDVARENLEWFQEHASSLVGNSAHSGDSIATSLFDLFAALLTPPVKAPVKYLEARRLVVSARLQDLVVACLYPSNRAPLLLQQAARAHHAAPQPLGQFAGYLPPRPSYF